MILTSKKLFSVAFCKAAMGAGIPYSVPSHTVTQACISSNQAITSGYKVGALRHTLFSTFFITFIFDIRLVVSFFVICL